MKTIKYRWLWLEYRYLAKRVEYELNHIDMLGKKLIVIRKDLEEIRTKLFLLDQDVKAGLEKNEHFQSL